MDSTLNALSIILHLVAINVWLGGTFFSVVVLGAAVSRLDTPQQLMLMGEVLRRFFVLVWVAMAALLASGSWMVYRLFGGFGVAPLYIRLMALFGVSMMLVFLVTYFVPYQHYRHATKNQDLEDGVRQLVRIRRLAILSIVLGACVVISVGGGPHLLG